LVETLKICSSETIGPIWNQRFAGSYVWKVLYKKFFFHFNLIKNMATIYTNSCFWLADISSSKTIWPIRARLPVCKNEVWKILYKKSFFHFDLTKTWLPHTIPVSDWLIYLLQKPFDQLEPSYRYARMKFVKSCICILYFVTME